MAKVNVPTVEEVLEHTTRIIPKKEGYLGLVLQFAEYNDTLEPWMGNPTRRDKQLVKFWKEEPFLASAVNSIAMTRSALSWELGGTPKTVRQVQNLLNSANFGQGWQHLMMQINIDILTTDNGGFIEVIRQPPQQGRKPETMPVIGIAHLPSVQCIRTGNPLEPVIYVDANGDKHPLKWYQVITLVENPVPESLTGRQFCFVSRVLKFATIIRDILQHHEEKISGRFSKAIHIVAGVSQGEVEEVQTRANYGADNAGLLRYMQPVILTTLDPNAKVSKETIELATLPDGFDLNTMMNWYITLLALASGSDYQEFAPLSSGNLGTASQSDTLHRKAQRKGTQLFIKIIETALYQARVIPPTITFRFKQQDAQAEREEAEIQQIRAKTREIQIKTGEITPQISRQIAVDDGDLKQEYLIAMGDTDITPDVTVSDDETVSEELINLGKTVGLKASWAAADFLVETLEAHPLQAISPIDNVRLVTLKENLRNLNVGGVLGTDTVWMSPILVKAALKSGIPPQMLRQRLPNNYRVVTTDTKVFDNRGRVWIRPENVTTPLPNPLDGFEAAFTKESNPNEKIGVIYRFAKKLSNNRLALEKVLKECQVLIQLTDKPQLFELKLRELLLQSSSAEIRGKTTTTS